MSTWALVAMGALVLAQVIFLAGLVVYDEREKRRAR